MADAQPSQRAFLTVLSGQAVSAFGSGLTSFAVAVWVYQQTQSLIQFGLVMFVNALVTAVSAPFLGVACDRYPLRRMMLIGDCGAALLTTLMLVLVLSGQLSLWILLIAVAADAVFSTLHQIAYRAAIPAFVPAQGLARANGMVETGFALSNLLAPLSAGALIGTIGLAGILIIDLLTFAFAVVTLVLARFPQVSSAAAAKASAAGQGVLESIGEGWRYLRSNPLLIRLLLVVIGGSFALSGVQVLFAPMVLAAYGAPMLGVMTTLAGLGALSAGLLVSFGGRSVALHGLLGCQLVIGVLLVAIAGAATVWWLGASVLAMHAASQWGSISSRTIWQREVDATVRGRVFATVSASAALVVPLANIGAPWLAEGVVKPWLGQASAGAEWVLRVFGDGPEAAAAVTIGLLGLLLMAFASAALLSPSWRRLRVRALTSAAESA